MPKRNVRLLITWAALLVMLLTGCSAKTTTPSESVFASISVGQNHACGVWPDGTVECWGDNGEGQATPTAGKFVSVSAGSEHTCGVRIEGAVECWGGFAFGKAEPPKGGFSSGQAGDGYICGVRSRDRVVCWGSDEDWRGKTISEVVPPAWEFSSVSAGFHHTCGVMTDGTVVCWGDNGEGQAAPPAGEFFSVRAGGEHTCGVRTDGTVECWGGKPTSGDLAELSRVIQSIGEAFGDGDPTPPPIPRPDGIFSSISAGVYHTCGVRADGSILCWGENHFGQADAPGGAFSSVSGGLDHTCGVRIDGTVVCWGSNTNWEDKNIGQAEPPDGEFSSVSAGDYRTCGVRTDGTVVCWGESFEDYHFIDRRPRAPQSLRYVWDNSTVVVSWDASEGAEYYAIYYDERGTSCRIDHDGPVFCDELSTNIPVNSYVHTNPEKDRDENHYWIAACNSHGCSNVESDNWAEYIDTRPTVPQNVRAQLVPDGTQIQVSWDPVPVAERYEIYVNCSRNIWGVSCKRLASDIRQTSYHHTNPVGQDNRYWVVACNSGGCSDVNIE